MKIKFLFIFGFLITMNCFGQINENFDSTVTGWSFSGAAVNTNEPCSGTKAVSNTGSGQYAITPSITNPDKLNCNTKRGSGMNAWSLDIQISDASPVSQTSGPWTTISTIGATATCSAITQVDLSSYTGVRYVRFIDTRGGGSQSRSFDDVVISKITAPTITVTPTTLTGFTYTFGAGPSANQTFAASGINLSANLILTAPTDYEISLASGSGFGSSLALTPVSGTVNATTIYTRLKAGLAVGTYNNEIISATSTSATTKTVTCSGNVTASITPTISLTPTTLTGFTYAVGTGPSANQTFTASGSNLTANITLTAPTNYEISKTAPGTAGFASTQTLSPTLGTVNATTIYVRLKAGLAVGSYNSEVISATSTLATTKTVTCSGIVTNSSNSDIIAVVSSEAATISSTINNAAPLTSSTGVQVWQFKVRDGGATLNDNDTATTILTDFTLAQAVGNSVSTWTDAINTVALFDGSTFIATGTVTNTPSHQIQFTGLNITVNDNTEKTLSIRLSLKCPLGVGAIDGNDFGFSLSNANATFSAAGSGKSAFSAQTSANGLNVIGVVATQLIFSTQPTTTGIGATMSTVTVTAKDACGNVDLGFTGNVSITSTGTMTGSPITVAAVAGVATFNTIIHNVVGTGLTLNATSTGLTPKTSTTFDIYTATILQKGDLAIVAVNTTAASSGSEDEFSFVCLENISPGTTLFITDNGYERVSAGLWGNTEGVISITRTGSILTKGTIITIHTVDNGVNDTSDFTVYTCGTTDANWTKGVVSPATSFFDLNKNDQMWIMQGGSWGNLATGNQDATYSGNILYGWTDIDWKTSINYASASGSTIVSGFECFTTDVNNAVATASFVKFNDPVNPDFSTTTNGKYDWIGLINNPLNWDSYTDNTTYNAGGYAYQSSTTCPAMTIASVIYVNGKWTGKRNTNWFFCGNWDSLKVPDETVDVLINDNTYNNPAKIESTALYASTYGSIAKTKNLTITGEKVQIEASTANKLEVHGNLIISGTGEVDMSDDTNGTPDGQLYLYGDWDNQRGETYFNQGEGTVYISGTGTQVIGMTSPDGTEIFHNVVFDNNFETKNSNSIIADGDITIRSNKKLTIGQDNYVKINNNLTIAANATLDILHQGSLIMVSDSGTITNNGTMNALKTTPSYEQYDYTYWSSPMANTTISSALGSWRNDYTLQFNAANYSDVSPYDGFDDNGDQWSVVSQATVMSPAKGYAVMAPTSGTFPATNTVTFTGTVNNGVITTPIFLSANNASTVDDYNLVGNPYPSAISADDFINGNPNISGTLYFWTHVGTRSTANPGPDQYNYSANDYALYNLTGGTAATSPPNPSSGSSATPTGDIVSGQGFMVEAITAGNVTFNNAMRLKGASNSIVIANTNFYKSADEEEVVKDRIWFSLQNELGISSPQLIGYLPETTLGFDRAYDGVNNAVKGYINFYSVMEEENYKIQSRGDFEPTDKVTLGYGLENAGQFKIKIDTAEGVLNNPNINVYIEDKLLNITHNLKDSEYGFTSEAGQFNDRFVLKYIDESLSTDDYENIANTFAVAVKNQIINLRSSVEPIKSIAVYDILGRIIFEKNNIDTNDFYIDNIKVNQQTLIIKSTLNNGQVVTRKVIL
ncbi:MAG: T9SS sorting signal type C domain-containing protein [Bacteroidota bacterium]